MTVALFDYDPIIYAAGSVSEKRHIHVANNDTGDEYKFDTRTAFYGEWRKKSGGWLAEFNKDREFPYSADEFTITDVQTPEPLEDCLKIVNSLIKGYTSVVSADTYYGYSGRGKVFREDISTILKYKGNRDNSLRPLHLDSIKDHLVKHHGCGIVEIIESDDACAIDSANAYKKWMKTKSDDDKVILMFCDKDFYQTAGHLYNTNSKGDICSYDGFGWLNINDKGAVKGRGRMWLYHQVLSSDVSDNYAANSASDKKWGEKSSYKLLKDCRNDTEALSAMVAGYKTIYPESKVIKGWRGDDILIDWKYVFNENFNLAKMLRSRDEPQTNVPELLDKLGVSY